MNFAANTPAAMLDANLLYILNNENGLNAVRNCAEGNKAGTIETCWLLSDKTDKYSKGLIDWSEWTELSESNAAVLAETMGTIVDAGSDNVWTDVPNRY